MKRFLLSSAIASLAVAGAAHAQTTLPLNTGYNSGTFTIYPLPTGSSTVSDNYWIKVAASSPPVPQTGFVVNPHPLWAPALPGSRWTSPTGNAASVPGTSSTNPAYYIFRKCFCLMPGYQNPQIRYQLRGDEATQVWLNSVTNVISGPSPSNFTASSPIVNGQTTNASWFRTGVNCIYVLVEDTGGSVGFNLAGAVTATGLMPVAGAGTGSSFAPCQCGGATGRAASLQAFNDRAMVQAIVRFAEERRRRRQE